MIFSPRNDFYISISQSKVYCHCIDVSPLKPPIWVLYSLVWWPGFSCTTLGTFLLGKLAPEHGSHAGPVQKCRRLSARWPWEKGSLTL